MDVWDWILVAHLLGMAFFVGGQLFLGLAVVPAFRGVEGPERERLRAIARRFGHGSLVALAVQLATGSALAGHLHKWSSTTLQVKLGLVAVTIALVAWHIRHPRQPAIDAAILVASLAIVALGVAL